MTRAPIPLAHRRRAAALLALLTLLAAACGSSGAPAGPPAIDSGFRLEVVASGLGSPVHVAAPPGDAGRLFVVEQVGRIRVVRGGAVLPAPFLDIAARVASGGERGLLSVAFHPDFAANGRFFVYYTAAAAPGDEGALGDVRVSEFTAPDPAEDVADPASEMNLLTIEHSEFGNHNGGSLAFGPDGLLYAGVGDGGGGGDPDENGQNRGTLLGKLLRLDVAAPGTPVPGNPFGNAIYHYGLRNPWRFGFDRATGDLYIGDVGQNAWEEVDYQPAAAAGAPPAPGTNWGWSVMEGTHCFRPSTGCNQAGLALPAVEYPHPDGGGASVVGGFVYRGLALPDLAASGTYFYGDTISGFVRTFRMQGGVATDEADVTAALGGPFPGLASFGEDADGELLLVTLDGVIRKLVPAP